MRFEYVLKKKKPRIEVALLVTSLRYLLRKAVILSMKSVFMLRADPVFA